MSDNKKAFPATGGNLQNGMDLRDWFAGQALANAYTHESAKPDNISGWAYQIADAMMKARKEPIK